MATVSKITKPNDITLWQEEFWADPIESRTYSEWIADERPERSEVTDFTAVVYDRYSAYAYELKDIDPYIECQTIAMFLASSDADELHDEIIFQGTEYTLAYMRENGHIETLQLYITSQIERLSFTSEEEEGSSEPSSSSSVEIEEVIEDIDEAIEERIEEEEHEHEHEEQEREYEQSSEEEEEEEEDDTREEEEDPETIENQLVQLYSMLDRYQRMIDTTRRDALKLQYREKYNETEDAIRRLEEQLETQTKVSTLSAEAAVTPLSSGSTPTSSPRPVPGTSTPAEMKIITYDISFETLHHRIPKTTAQAHYTSSPLASPHTVADEEVEKEIAADGTTDYVLLSRDKTFVTWSDVRALLSELDDERLEHLIDEVYGGGDDGDLRFLDRDARYEELENLDDDDLERVREFWMQMSWYKSRANVWNEAQVNSELLSQLVDQVDSLVQQQ